MNPMLRNPIIAIALLGQFVQAGIYMRQKKHTDAMEIMGQTQPAEDSIEEIWIDSNGFRSDSPERSMIYNTQKKQIVIIDHQNKTYMEMPLGEDMFSRMTEGEDEENTDGMQNMMKEMMKINMEVNSTSEKKIINQWSCQKYNMTLITAMGQFNAEIWATESLRIDPELYKLFSSSIMAMIHGMQQSMDQVQKEMQKIKGVYVLNVTSNQVMGQTVRSSTELIEFKEGITPADLLQIPAGYKKQTFQDM